jgi:type IV pilus assembly protein PilE
MHRKSLDDSCGMPRAACGFSAIELLVVLAVIAILALTQLPSYQESVRKAKRAEGRAALVQLMQQQERYYSQHTTYAIFSSNFENGFKWYSGDSPAASAYEISAKACKEDVIQNCVVLTAEPGTARVNASYRDEVCGSLTLTSGGVQGAERAGKSCW